MTTEQGKVFAKNNTIRYINIFVGKVHIEITCIFQLCKFSDREKTHYDLYVKYADKSFNDYFCSEFFFVET